MKAKGMKFSHFVGKCFIESFAQSFKPKKFFKAY